ncbi:MAG: outer membrane beta-barrel protein [Candidatus Dadabacteria bacterium]
MRKIILILTAFYCLNANAQNIKGSVTDGEGGPLAGATVSILQVKDSSIVKLGISDRYGAYAISGVKDGKYLVSASFVGYMPSYSTVFTLGNSDVTIQKLQLNKTTGDLKNVVVTARKPLVEVKADKTILNVEGTMNAEGLNALDLMRRSPGVVVDKDENLSLSGKNGVQVYIDGRPSPLSGQDLANYLKMLPSSQVESIEIITNPSAKYEAAGSAGIINIRLKKNKAFGVNGSGNMGYNVSTFSRYNASTNLNYRNRNINIYGTYSLGKGIYGNGTNLYRTILDSAFNQSNDANYEFESHNLKLGTDYTLNKVSSVGMIFNAGFTSPTIRTTSHTLISYEPTKVVSRILQAQNLSDMKRNNYSVNLNYNYEKQNGPTLTVNADKGYYDISTNQYQPNVYLDPTGQVILNTVTYRMITPSHINISSLKADYEMDFKKGKLGFGGKTALVNTDNDFQRYNVINSVNQLDRDRSNEFDYNENINALYLNYNKSFKGFLVQAGVRGENTISKGTSTGLKYTGAEYEKTNTQFRRSYLDLFPSAAITLNKKPMNQWTFTYSRRIDRPNYQDLNPFEFKLDEYTYQKGNTDLQPQYTNSFGITNLRNYKFNATFNYSHVNNLFTNLIDTTEKTKAIQTRKNMANRDVFNITLSYPYTHKNLTVFTNLNGNYSQYRADYGTGRKVNLNAFGLVAFSQASLKFAKTWTGELMGFYVAPSIFEGLIKIKGFWDMDAGLSKTVLKGKGTIKAAMGDVFHTMNIRGNIDFAGQKVDVRVFQESQQFRLNFNFRFGSTQIKAAKQRQTGAEDETKRVQTDNSGGGLNVPKQ